MWFYKMDLKKKQKHREKEIDIIFSGRSIKISHNFALVANIILTAELSLQFTVRLKYGNRFSLSSTPMVTRR